MKEPRDAYKVLQVDPEADLEVIQAAYRRLAQKYHPDRVMAGADGDVAALRMVELNAAWDQLRDPTVVPPTTATASPGLRPGDRQQADRRVRHRQKPGRPRPPRDPGPDR